jgi:hypothetical protein
MVRSRFDRVFIDRAANERRGRERDKEGEKKRNGE